MSRTGALVFIFLTSLASSCKSDTTQIKNCFENFKTAIFDHDGDAAINYIDKETINYYSKLLEKVKKLDSLQLEQEPFIEKLTILKVRHVIPKHEILAMDGKRLIIASINAGITNNGGINSYAVGKITLKDSLATAEKLSDGRRTPMRLHFSKENSSWKYCMVCSFPPIVDFRQLQDHSVTE